jgi:hypothetical protein
MTNHRPTDGLAARLVGAWSLVSISIHRGDAEQTWPLGSSPTGRFMFDAEGNYSVQLENGSRGRESETDYVASWGTYVVSEPDQSFTITLQGSLQRRAA